MREGMPSILPDEIRRHNLKKQDADRVSTMPIPALHSTLVTSQPRMRWMVRASGNVLQYLFQPHGFDRKWMHPTCDERLEFCRPLRLIPFPCEFSGLFRQPRHAFCLKKIPYDPYGSILGKSLHISFASNTGTGNPNAM